MVDTQQFKSKLGSETYKEFALSKDQLLELRAAVDSHYCKFTHRLHDMYPDLSCDDIDYCCLYLLGLKDADISALMQRDYSTVCYRNRKIKNIIKSKKNLSETLNNLAD